MDWEVQYLFPHSFIHSFKDRVPNRGRGQNRKQCYKVKMKLDRLEVKHPEIFRNL